MGQLWISAQDVASSDCHSVSVLGLLKFQIINNVAFLFDQYICARH